MPPDTTDRQLVWVVLVLVAALFVLPAFVMGVWMMGTGPMMDGGGHMWGMGDGVASWMLVIGVVVQLLFLAILVGAGYLGLRRLTSTEDASDPAIEELRIAYARGDLDEEEFERRRDRLESSK